MFLFLLSGVSYVLGMFSVVLFSVQQLADFYRQGQAFVTQTTSEARSAADSLMAALQAPRADLAADAER